MTEEGSSICICEDVKVDRHTLPTRVFSRRSPACRMDSSKASAWQYLIGRSCGLRASYIAGRFSASGPNLSLVALRPSPQHVHIPYYTRFDFSCASREGRTITSLRHQTNRTRHLSNHLPRSVLSIQHPLHFEPHNQSSSTPLAYRRLTTSNLFLLLGLSSECLAQRILDCSIQQNTFLAGCFLQVCNGNVTQADEADRALQAYCQASVRAVRLGDPEILILICFFWWVGSIGYGCPVPFHRSDVFFDSEPDSGEYWCRGYVAVSFHR